MIADIQTVLRLQSLDNKGAGLQKEIAALPRHVAEIEKKLDSHMRRLSVDRAALAANQKDRKSLEDDIKVHEQKISKLRDQMLQAKTNEQYRAFQSEIEFCERETRKAEDRILELMTASEPLDKAVRAAEVSLKAEKEEVDAEKARAQKRTAEDEGFLAQVMDERRQVVSSLDPKIYTAYERIRKKWHGTAIADGTSGRCSACQITLRPQYFQDLKKAERLLNCESCGRMLYYNPPVSLEHELHSQPVRS